MTAIEQACFDKLYNLQAQNIEASRNGRQDYHSYAPAVRLVSSHFVAALINRPSSYWRAILPNWLIPINGVLLRLTGTASNFSESMSLKVIGIGWTSSLDLRFIQFPMCLPLTKWSA
jgi:hypothetical protein